MAARAEAVRAICNPDFLEFNTASCVYFIFFLFYFLFASQLNLLLQVKYRKKIKLVSTVNVLLSLNFFYFC